MDGRIVENYRVTNEFLKSNGQAKKNFRLIMLFVSLIFPIMATSFSYGNFFLFLLILSCFGSFVWFTYSILMVQVNDQSFQTEWHNEDDRTSILNGKTVLGFRFTLQFYIISLGLYYFYSSFDSIKPILRFVKFPIIEISLVFVSIVLFHVLAFYTTRFVFFNFVIFESYEPVKKLFLLDTNSISKGMVIVFCIWGVLYSANLGYIEVEKSNNIVSQIMFILSIVVVQLVLIILMRVNSNSKMLHRDDLSRLNVSIKFTR